ncbi:hypothetical protein Tco_1046822 [Tanacetum coccineum]
MSSRLLAFTSFLLHAFSSTVAGKVIFIVVDVPVSGGVVSGTGEGTRAGQGKGTRGGRDERKINNLIQGIKLTNDSGNRSSKSLPTIQGNVPREQERQKTNSGNRSKNIEGNSSGNHFKRVETNWIQGIQRRERDRKFDSGNQVLPTRKEKKRPTIQGIVAEQDRMKRIVSGNQSREETGRAHTAKNLGVKQMKEDSDKGNKDVRDEIEDISNYRAKAKMKVIKDESEVLGLLKIDDDLFTCDTPLRTIFDEFNRLSVMDDDLFIYEVGNPGLSYFPSVEQQYDNLEYGDLDVYERKVCYDEFIKGNSKITWKLKKQKEVYGLDAEMEYDPSNVDFAEWIDDWIYEWNKGIPWVDKKPWTDNGVLKEPTDNIDHVCKSFCFKSGHAEWPTCNWREDGYCNKGNLPRMIQVGNTIHYQDYEWYEALEDSDPKDKALNNKSILEGSKKEEEEPSEDAWSHYSSIDEWEDFERANHIGTNVNSDYNPNLDTSRILNNHVGMNNDPIEDEQELIRYDSDDIRDFDDNLVSHDAPYFAN